MQNFKKMMYYLCSKFIIPIVVLITLLTGLILIVSTPPVWEGIYDIAMPEEKLKSGWRHDAKTISRAFWNGDSYSEINKNFANIKMHKKEVIHFEDVRNLIHALVYPCSIGLFILLCWTLLFKQSILWHWSLLYVSVCGITLAIWGAIAWRHLFHTLHWWIFQNDSWILPKGCYSVKLYPYAVWQLTGGLVLGSLFILLLGLSLPTFLKYAFSKKEEKTT